MPKSQSEVGLQVETYLQQYQADWVRDVLFLCALVTIEEDLRRDELVPF